MDRGVRAACCLALVILVATAFWPAIGNDFVNYDDQVYLTENPMVRQGLTRESVAWALTTFDAHNWHPLTWLSHLLDVQLFGLEPAGHHAVGILLHAAAALLFCLCLGMMTGARWAPFLAAALWALHPLRVESVAWAAERKDVLCALLWMASIVLYLRHLRRPSAGRAAAVAASFALALTAKPMAVTLPVVLLLLDWWPLGRLRRGADLPRLAAEKLPLLTLAALSSALTLAAQRQAMGLNELVPLASRLANAVVSYGRYLETTLRPASMALVYPHLGRTLGWPAAVPMALLLGAVSLLAWMNRRRLPAFAAGWLWYLVALVPVIGVVQVGKQAMADRYTYLPSAGLVLAALWGLGALLRPPWCRRTLAVVLFGLACLMVPLTRAQTSHWRNDLSLFSYAVERDPRDWVSRNLLGVEFLKRGDIPGAQREFGEALRLKPDFPDALFNAGLTHQARGEHAAAATSFLRAASLDIRDAEARFQAARELSAIGDLRNALVQAEEALRLEPGNASFARLRVEIAAALPP